MDISALSGGDSEKKNGYPHLDSEVSLLIVYRNFTTADLFNNTKRKLEKVGIKPS